MAEPVRTSPLAGLAVPERVDRRRRAGDAHRAAVPRQADAARRRCMRGPRGAGARRRAARHDAQRSRRRRREALWLGPGRVAGADRSRQRGRDRGRAARGACRRAPRRGRGQRPHDRDRHRRRARAPTSSTPAARWTCIRAPSRPARSTRTLLAKAAGRAAPTGASRTRSSSGSTARSRPMLGCSWRTPRASSAWPIAA